MFPSEVQTGLAGLTAWVCCRILGEREEAYKWGNTFPLPQAGL